MASMTTPFRVNRGHLVSVVDTKSPAVDDVATVLSYGLHTPPHSAHESRRPSLQYSWCSTPGVDATTYSQPSTPIHQVHQTHDSFMQSWPELNSATPKSTCPRTDTSFVGAAFADLNVHGTLGDASIPGADWSQYTTNDPFGATFPSEQLPSNAWTPAGDATGAFTTQPSWMGPALVSATHSLRSGNDAPDPIYERVRSAFQRLDSGFDIDPIHAVPRHSDPRSPVYHDPGIVVPSQLAPLDVLCQPPTVDYTTPNTSSDGFHGDNSSYSNSTLGSFEFVESLSPTGAYTDHSDNEDYVMVPREATYRVAKPNRRLTRTSLKALRRQASKRPRSEEKAWHSQETAGIQIDCIGPLFSLRTPPSHKGACTTKNHVCRFIKDDGTECGSRFQRSEHLKRHEGMHSSYRAFPCPIDGCPQASSRSDNACDHFKKHLEPHKSGKRTAYVEWATLHDRIVKRYDERTAGKLIENLQRWIDAGMPKAAARTRLLDRDTSPMSLGYIGAGSRSLQH